MLIENLFRRSIGKQPQRTRNAEPRAKSPGELGSDPPVVSRLAGRCYGRAHTRNTPFGISDRAFFLTPCSGGQNEIGVMRGVDVAIRILHDDEFTVHERLTYALNIGHRLGRIGACDPDGLDVTAANRVEQLDGCLAGL